MDEKREEVPSPAEQDVASQLSPEASHQPELPSRRQLIERYGKYAIVAAPLLLFASKAHAIRSRP